MVQKSKKEYLESIRARYLAAGRKHKKQILDEFCANCSYHRKSAIRMLNGGPCKRQRRPGRPSEYGSAEREVLEEIWLTSNRLCSRRLRAAIKDWLPHYEKMTKPLKPETRERLMNVSTRTLDRLLIPVRRKHGLRGKCGTRPGALARELIPIRTEHAEVTQPGVIEADTVAHCGNSLEGDFVWSLTMTDIFSGWTENRAVWNKGYAGIKDAIVQVREKLPFPVTGFHSDNGGEFLNHHLIHYFQEMKAPVSMSRSRPYHKNDTAHVEQKNYTHVRMLLGYRRLENQGLLPSINELYTAWSLFNNYFSPVLKLIDKKKIGSRYIKTYDEPKTPYRRLMDSPHVPELMKTYLTEVFTHIDPFKIKRLIDHQQNEILKHLR